MKLTLRRSLTTQEKDQNKPQQSEMPFAIVDGEQITELPKDLYIPIFAIGRAPGWVAQCIEQFETNILIRPLTEYIGPKNMQFKDISER